ncbi:MAG: nucleoside triphosphate pyrophosphohydrolase [Rhodothermales bacterium]|nr:nucleoside triphosphate pyrophosphohydrolase [Rhodothermales bacterium]
MPKIYDPQFEEHSEGLEAYADFVAIVRQLRRDCPWDREQTHESVKHLLIEEAYETVDAIDANDWDELKRELGDLLLHVVFHSVIAEKDGRFILADVIRAETDKLVRRHPHVFGDVAVENVDEVLSNWEQIKLSEGTRRSVLEGIPGHLPALLRAHRMQEKAAGVGFDFPTPADAWDKVREEGEEFERLNSSGAEAAHRDSEFGDLLFSLVNYARLTGLNAENALRHTINKFSERFRYVEETLEARGRSVAEATLDEMDALWEDAKLAER